MKISKLILTIAVLLIISGCNRKIVPGLKQGMDGNQYDQAAFNYVYVEGIKQKLLGNLGEALNTFEKCLEINPQSDASYYQMAQIVLSSGDLNNGKKYLKKASEIAPDNIWYGMMLAGIYMQLNNIDSAIIFYERIVKRYPDKEDLQISLAKLYSQNKNYEKAGNILERLEERHGINENTTNLLIENLITERKYREAMEKIQQSLALTPDDIVVNGYMAEVYQQQGESQKAKEVYKQLIDRNPENPGIQLSLFDFLLSEKNYDELFNLLNVIVLNERITKEAKISLIAELIDNAQIINNYGNKLEVAIMILEANYKNDDIILVLRPELLQKMKKLNEAAFRLEEIIKLKPDNYFAWEKLLLVYYELKDFTNLQKRGEECATKFNRSVIAKMLYATASMENRNYEVAIEELKKADILAGDNKDLKIQILTIRADVFYRIKNYSDAFSAFDEALKLNNNDLTVMNNYAYFLAEQNMKLKEAEEMAKIVIEKEKANNTFLDTYAWVLYKRGKLREASKIMEKILNSEEKEDAEYFEHYGYILKKMKKCDEAIENWNKALTIDKTKENLLKEIENCRK